MLFVNFYLCISFCAAHIVLRSHIWNRTLTSFSPGRFEGWFNQPKQPRIIKQICFVATFPRSTSQKKYHLLPKHTFTCASQACDEGIQDYETFPWKASDETENTYFYDLDKEYGFQIEGNDYQYSSQLVAGRVGPRELPNEAVCSIDEIAEEQASLLTHTNLSSNGEKTKHTINDDIMRLTRGIESEEVSPGHTEQSDEELSADDKLYQFARKKVTSEEDFEVYKRLLRERELDAKRDRITRDMKRLAEHIPCHYSEKETLIEMGRLKKERTDEMVGPLSWVNRLAEQRQFDAFATQLGQELENYNRVAKSFPFEPSNDNEYRMLVEEQHRPDHYNRYTLLQKVRYHLNSSFKKNVHTPTRKKKKNGKRSVLSVVMVIGAAVVDRYIMKSSVAPASLLVGTVLCGARLSAPLKALLGSTAKDTPTLLGIHDFLEKNLVDVDDLPNELSNEDKITLFSEALFLAATNRDLSLMWRNEIPQLLGLRDKLRISKESLIGVTESVFDRFLRCYCCSPDGKDFDGLQHYFEKRSCGIFMDKLLFITSALQRNHEGKSEYDGVLHLSNLFNLPKKWLLERLEAIKIEGYEAQLRSLFPVGCLQCQASAGDHKVAGIPDHVKQLWTSFLGLTSEEIVNAHWKLFHEELQQLLTNRGNKAALPSLQEAELIALGRKVDGLAASLNLERTKAFRAVFSYTRDAYMKSLLQVIELSKKDAALKPSAIDTITELSFTHYTPPEEFIRSFLKLLSPWMRQLRSDINRYCRLNNRQMTVETAEQIVAIYNALPELVEKVACGDKKKTLKRFNLCIAGLYEDDMPTSQLEIEIVRRVAHDIMVENFTSNSTWRRDVAEQWVAAMGSPTEIVSSERLSLCCKELEAEVTSKFDGERSRMIWLTGNRREDFPAILKKRLELSDHEYTTVSEKAFSGQVEKCHPKESLLKLPLDERVRKFADTLLISKETQTKILTDHFRESYRLKVEMLSDFQTGWLSPQALEDLDVFKEAVSFSPVVARKIEIAVLYNYIQSNLWPRILKELLRATLPESEFLERYSEDKGDDVYRDNSSASLGLHPKNDQFLELCDELLMFYDRNKLFDIPIKSNLQTDRERSLIDEKVNQDQVSRRVVFDLGLIGELSDRQKIVEQWLLKAYLRDGVIHANTSGEISSDKLSRISQVLGFLPSDVDKISHDFRVSLYRKVMQESFDEAPDVVDKIVEEDLIQLERDLGLDNQLCEKMRKKAKMVKLKQVSLKLAGTNLSGWTVTIAQKLKSFATKMNIDFFESLGLSSETKKKWLRHLISSGIDSSTSIDVRQMFEETGHTKKEGESILQEIVIDEISDLLKACFTSIREDKYPKAMGLFGKLTQWSYINGEEWSYGDIRNEVLRDINSDDVRSLSRVVRCQAFASQRERKTQLHNLNRIFDISKMEQHDERN